jgi:hypothetical protein
MRWLHLTAGCFYGACAAYLAQFIDPAGATTDWAGMQLATWALAYNAGAGFKRAGFPEEQNRTDGTAGRV